MPDRASNRRPLSHLGILPYLRQRAISDGVAATVSIPRHRASEAADEIEDLRILVRYLASSDNEVIDDVRIDLDDHAVDVLRRALSEDFGRSEDR